MSDSFEDMVLRRLDRIEAANAFNVSLPDRSDDIDALRKELTSLKVDIRNRDIEIRDLRTLVASKVGPSDVAATINKHIPQHITVVGDFIADTVLDAQKTMRDELGDATRAIHRDVERAELAASSNIKSAAAVIASWASELGA